LDFDFDLEVAELAHMFKTMFKNNLYKIF